MFPVSLLCFLPYTALMFLSLCDVILTDVVGRELEGVVSHLYNHTQFGYSFYIQTGGSVMGGYFPGLEGVQC